MAHNPTAGRHKGRATQQQRRARRERFGALPRLSAGELVGVPADAVPQVVDARLEVDPRTRTLRFVSAEVGELAAFVWWVDLDASLARVRRQGPPLGSRREPFHDLDQGWELVIFEEAGLVYLFEGDGDGEFALYFKMPADAYRAAWRRVLG